MTRATSVGAGCVQARPPVLASLLLSLALGGCSGLRGCGDGVVAELSGLSGDVQRDRASAVGHWVAAALRDEFAMGDGVRTGKDASAVLRVLPKTQLFVQPQSVVRFSVVAPEATSRVRLEAGEVAVETAGVELDIETGEGVARLAGGTRTRVRSRGGQVRFDIAVGQVRVESDGGERVFGAGEGFTLEVGAVVREDAEDSAEETPPETTAEPALEPTAAVAEDASGPGAEWLLGPGTPFRFSLPAGETATIHDPDAPTTFGLRFASCKGPAEVEVEGRGIKGGQARGVRSRVATLRLPMGGFRYRVRCPEAADGAMTGPRSLSGRLVVRRDAGTQRLPREAPEVSVEADGRRYTVRYQNRLPRIRFSWPRAPAARGYELSLRSRLGQRRHKAPGPDLTLPAASLPEGEYTFRFSASDGRRSPEGVVNITFDNTARAAALVSPRTDTPLHVGPVVVAGVALRGSRVRVQSQPVPVGKNGRFKATIEPLIKGSDLVIRVEHRRGGLHYYLRR